MANQYVSIEGLDLEIESCQVSWYLDAADTFDVSLIASALDWKTARGKAISLISNGRVLISGFIDKRPRLQQRDGSPLMANLTCMGELGRLAQYRAVTTAHYQNVAVLVILNELAASSGAWEVQLNNMVDAGANTTVDLRSKETLFGQVMETIKSVPQLHIRYGGVNPDTGLHIMEIGNFNEITAEAVEGFNLVETPQLEFSANEVYRECEALGALSGDSRITLEDALLDPRTTTHADYATFPIIADVNGYVVRNLDQPSGASVTKSFNMNKTENNDQPSPEEKAQAGYALWRKAVRFLQKSVDYETYSGSYISHTQSRVGDRIYIRSKIEEPIFDPVTNQIVAYHPTLSVEGDYRLTKLTYKYDRGFVPSELSLAFEEDAEIWQFEATSNDEAEQTDPELELYERLETYTDFDAQTASAGATISIQGSSVIFDGTAPADCTAVTALDSKYYEIYAPTSIPDGAVLLGSWAVAQPGDARISNIIPPATLADPWQGCVRPATSNWSALPDADEIQITIFWQYQI